MPRLLSGRSPHAGPPVPRQQYRQPGDEGDSECCPLRGVRSRPPRDPGTGHEQPERDGDGQAIESPNPPPLAEMQGEGAVAGATSSIWFS